MATATANRPRPAGTTTHHVTVELVPALLEDLNEVIGWKANNPDVQKKKLRVGMIYWLYSHVKNEMEPTPRIITSNCNTTDLNEWLDANMIFIAKNQFDL